MKIKALIGVGVVAVVGLLATATPANATVTQDDFTIALVPDTQFAAASYPDLMTSQFTWLRDHAEELNLKMVLQEGDVVDTETSQTQWDRAYDSYSLLSGHVPLVIANGNHDSQDYTVLAKKLGIKRTEVDDYLIKHPDVAKKVATQYPVNNSYFTTFINRFSDYQIDGEYVQGDPSNMYRKFTINGDKWMVMNLQFGAPAQVLAWANTIAQANGDTHIIVLTHDFLGSDSTVRDASDLSVATTFNSSLANPNTAWASFKTRKAYQFVFSGHVNQKRVGSVYATGNLVTRDDADRYVYQLLTNFQMYDQGGDGFLRLLTFHPSTKTVDVKTYSPPLNVWMTGSASQFTFTNVNLAPRP